VLTHAPGRSFDVEDHGLVHEAVQDGGGDDRVAEDLTPFRQPSIGGDDGRVAPLIAGVDHVEEGSGSTAFDVLSFEAKVPSRRAFTKVLTMSSAVLK
jgi:hypothetical protein